jgi:hypothetical protein
VGEPFGWSAEGGTAEEALQVLRNLVARKVSGGVRIATLEVAPNQHPLHEFAGTLKDHSLLAEWKQAMAEYRESVDADPERH